MVLVAAILGASLMAGCDEGNEDVELEQLRIEVVRHSVAVTCHVLIFEGDDSEGPLVEDRTLMADQFERDFELYVDLPLGDYYVLAQTFDEDDSLLWDGAGNVSVNSWGDNELVILVNQ